MPENISIHTPTQGVTGAFAAYPHPLQNFNPHSHAGSDRFVQIVNFQLGVISIHTPTQGVTTNGRDNNPAQRNFNPHSHAGSDQ